MIHDYADLEDVQCVDPPAPGAKHVSLCTTLNRPFSRGTIHAVSLDPLNPPAIDPHYFEEEVGTPRELLWALLLHELITCTDLQVWLEMVKFARRLGTTAPLKDMISQLHRSP